MTRATAPGKLMLAGEYSVVDPGGPALAVAVGRRVTVTVTVGGDRWTVSAPELDLDDASPEEAPVVAAVLRELDVSGGGSIRIASELGRPDSKLGLGSSAAVCVAVMGALQSALSLGETELDAAISAHREAQGGRGSGYDVATALVGGVCLFEQQGDEATARTVAWPDGLHAAVLSSGRPASTPKKLDAVRTWMERDPAVVDRHRHHMRDRSVQVIEAWLAGDVSRLLRVCADAQEALVEFDRAGDLHLVRGEYGRLLAAIEDAGAVARTSGAGGGDCAWALSGDPDVLEAAIAAAIEDGFDHLELGFPAAGLTLTDAALDGSES